MSSEISSTTGTSSDIRWGAATSSGMVRTGNEDAYLADDEVFVIADGMGGHQAGEVAAEIATTILGDRLRHGARSSGVVVAAAIEANAAIFQAAYSNPDQRGMGTTVTAIVRLRTSDESTHQLHRPIVAAATDPAATTDIARSSDADTSADTDTPANPATPDAPVDSDAPTVPERHTASSLGDDDARLVIVNVGDSRIYVARHGQLRRVTIDHSYVQELLATGHISEAEARAHPRRNIVTRALGIEPNVRVDSWVVPMVEGDRYVLCSDGLVDEVDDDEINAIVTSTDDPEQCAAELVAAANANGGRDNTTVIVVDMLRGQTPSAADLSGELDRADPGWADDHDRLIVADATPAPTVTGAPRKRRITVGSALFALTLLAIIAGVIVAIIAYRGKDDPTPTTVTTTSTTVLSNTTILTSVPTTASTPSTPASTPTVASTQAPGG